MFKQEIEKSVEEQRAVVKEKPLGIKRNMLQNLSLTSEFTIIISGIRRCGKSTLMLQLLRKVEDSFAYLNFEDPRMFGFSPEDFVKMNEVITRDTDYLFFDEIQNIDHWERMIRHFHDQGKKMCITGSNASLLSRDLGTKLTGRHISVELFPFSYEEFLSLKQLEASDDSILEYLQLGGFPDYLKYGQTDYLQQLLKDILNRDIIVRHGVRNANTLISIALFLISNVGKPYSLTRIKNTFGVGSTNSVADYVSWMEDSYLLFSVPKFSYSLKKVAINRKKVYCIDTGFAQANSLSYTEDKGRLFENMVFLQLRRKHKEIYYFTEKGECDFIVKEGLDIVLAVQVSYELNSDNREREVRGLMEALEFFNMNEATIVTMTQDDELNVEGHIIKIVSAAKWFLD